MPTKDDKKGPSNVETYVNVSEAWLDGLIKKAEDADFYKGKALGMEYVIDALADAIKE